MAIIGSAVHLAGSFSVEAVARIRAAVSSPWTDSAGTTWQPDSGYIGGAIHVGGVVPVHDTKDRSLYSSHRWGMATYQVPAPCPATYRVGLHFAEVIFTDPGKRVFGVSIEGRSVARNLDVVATVGAMRPLVMRATAEVTDGLLDIDFDRIVEDPMVSAIAVDRVSNCSGGGSPGRPRPDGDVTPIAIPTPTSTATPTPIPNPTTTPAETRYPSPAEETPSSPPDAPVDAGGYPDASNTGVKPGSDLKPSGSIIVTNDRAVLRDLDVTGSIHVLADNVRISNVRIRRPGGIAIRQDPSNHGLVIEDVEIDGRGNPDGSEAIGVANYTLRRANIYGVGEGPRTNGNVLVEDSYIHDLGSYLDQGAHQDAIQSTGGSNITIRHNRLENNVDGGNAAIMIGTSPGSNLLIEDNIVSGGGYAVYGGAYEGGGSENWTNVRVLNNRFSTKFYPQSGFYGPLLNVVGVTLSGNVWHETGRPLSS